MGSFKHFANDTFIYNEIKKPQRNGYFLSIFPLNIISKNKHQSMVFGKLWLFEMWLSNCEILLRFYRIITIEYKFLHSPN